MKISFFGAAHEVTGSCTLITVGGKNIVVDCGMEQGADIYENQELSVSPCDIDCVFLTHAHIDHSGLIPKLVKNGYKGNIYCTVATKNLCDIMLLDSAHIQEFEANWRNRKAKRSGGEEYVPIYTVEDAQKALLQFDPYSYHKPFSPFEGVTAEFFDAGHLLGSASIKFTLFENGETKTVLFSGDLGNINRPLIRDPEMPPEADYVIIESTYGDRLHGPVPDYVGELSGVLERTLSRGGNLVIPCFAVGRTQEMLYLLRIIKQKKLVSNTDFEVVVDSPLAVSATAVYSPDLTEYYDQETLSILNSGENPVNLPGLRLSVTAQESQMINYDNRPKVILSASGMCEAGRIRHHLKHNLWRADSTVLFVGYQSEGTVGRKLIDGEKRVKLFGEEIAVNCEIAVMSGISGHADRNMLLNWLKNLPKTPTRVFVNHGSDTVCDEFAKSIEDACGYTAFAPYSGDEFDLLNESLTHAPVKRIAKKSKGAARSETIYDRLLASFDRLKAVVLSYKGASNKDISRLADSVESLVDRYGK
ncbi:MAG: MBL fold metallo-hydrolase [Oscillospiraceae bacterium]|nr:MBL fold metallo-hydrolase [Candidatus Equicaccousia limihippi]